MSKQDSTTSLRKLWRSIQSETSPTSSKKKKPALHIFSKYQPQVVSSPIRPNQSINPFHNSILQAKRFYATETDDFRCAQCALIDARQWYTPLPTQTESGAVVVFSWDADECNKDCEMGRFIRGMIRHHVTFRYWILASLGRRDDNTGYLRARFQLDKDLVINCYDPCEAAANCIICSLPSREAPALEDVLPTMISKVGSLHILDDLSDTPEKQLLLLRQNHVPGWLKTVQFSIINHGSWTSLAVNYARTRQALGYGTIGDMILRPSCTEDRLQRVLVPYGGKSYGHGREMTDKLDPALIKSWLETCSGTHSGACRRPGLGNYPKNLLLIDVNQWCIVPVVKLDHEPRYAALSYVWGQARQPELCQSTVWVWTEPKALLSAQLPPTIKDAINLTKNIGLGFLWVDSLCIVQDHAANKALHIQQMHRIYSHAALTIAATGNDCWQGLFGMSKPLRFLDIPRDCDEMQIWSPDIRPMPFPKPGHRLGDLQFIEILRDPGHWLKTCLWRTRGWTFQEEICSKRMVYLLPNNVLFRCQQSTWRADVHLEHSSDFDLTPTTTSNESSSSGFTQLDAVRDLISNPYFSREDITESFRELIHAYILRRLTRSDDIENAIAGVAAMLEHRLGPVYHGIPEAFFGEVLEGCWYWDIVLARRQGGTPTAFPSWSWTGWIQNEKYSEIGIKPVRSHKDNSSCQPLLKIYKFSKDEVKPLFTQDPSPPAPQEPQTSDGNPSSSQPLPILKFSPNFTGEIPPSVAATVDIQPHFTHDTEKVLARHRVLTQELNTRDCIAFFTSIAYLAIDTSFKGGTDPHAETREFSVCDPNTYKVLTKIRLKSKFFIIKLMNVAPFPKLPFIVISRASKKRGRGPGSIASKTDLVTSYRLMMIEFHGDIAYKVNVTIPGTLVSEEDWCKARPYRGLIVMG